MRTIRTPHPIRLVAVLTATVFLLAACAGAAVAPGQDTGGDGLREPVFGGAPTMAPAPAPGDDSAAVDDAKIIRTGSLYLEVTDVPAAIRAARDTIRGLGGYVSYSSAYEQGGQPYAEITYRIPGDRWDEALEALRTLGGLTKKVVGEQTQAVEVTSQIVDLEARIRNLRAAETSLLAIYEKATRITDILEVQNQLTSVRGQIEQLEAQRVDLEDRVSYGTLTVSFQAGLAAITIASKDWDPAAIVDQATGALISALQGVAGAGIWFVIVWLPLLIGLAIVLGIVAGIVRRTGVLRRRGRGVAVPPPAAPATPEG
jgi:hypothetical protein